MNLSILIILFSYSTFLNALQPSAVGNHEIHEYESRAVGRAATDDDQSEMELGRITKRVNPDDNSTVIFECKCPCGPHDTSCRLTVGEKRGARVHRCTCACKGEIYMDCKIYEPSNSTTTENTSSNEVGTTTDKSSTKPVTTTTAKATSRCIEKGVRLILESEHFDGVDLQRCKTNCYKNKNCLSFTHQHRTGCWHYIYAAQKCADCYSGPNRGDMSYCLQHALNDCHHSLREHTNLNDDISETRVSSPEKCREYCQRKKCILWSWEEPVCSVVNLVKKRSYQSTSGAKYC
eukprot:TRINITY_DN8383_c0_g1_i1.p1 TRINITY_DN8383_c0_g1~~TRINITY_DN8383_c0_g1_i1.p1  ORF type:complete len:300 (+),score=24.79 TRINITY_DN8383_c0_g1_i1:30-902(+)